MSYHLPYLELLNDLTLKGSWILHVRFRIPVFKLRRSSMGLGTSNKALQHSP